MTKGSCLEGWRRHLFKAPLCPQGADISPWSPFQPFPQEFGLPVEIGQAAGTGPALRLPKWGGSCSIPRRPGGLSLAVVEVAMRREPSLTRGHTGDESKRNEKSPFLHPTQSFFRREIPWHWPNSQSLALLRKSFYLKAFPALYRNVEISLSPQPEVTKFHPGCYCLGKIL